MSRDSAARTLEREATTEAERRARQRDTLLELQEALHRMVRAEAAAQHADLLSFRSSRGGKWRGTMLPEDVSAEAHAAAIHVILLRERVLDDEIRLLCRRLADEAAAVDLAQSEDESLRRMDVVLATYEALNERLGTTLRSLL